MSEKLEYLVAALDFHLADGRDPVDAWCEALRNYAYAYHEKDGRTPLQRASEVALRYLKEGRDDTLDDRVPCHGG